MIYQTLLNRCPHTSTVGMSYESWLDKRREAIGGSDAGPIMGMSNFSSPLTVYLQKKNLVPKTETSKAARRGSLLEPVIRTETAKDFPDLEIEPIPFMFTDPDHPFMSANIDGLVYAKAPVEIEGETIAELGGFEAKSAKTSYGWSKDEVPDAYYCQVQHYMKVLNLDWFLVAAYILDDETINYYVIRRNEDFITRLVEAEQDFWESYVAKDIMPAPMGIDNEDDMITGMFDGTQEILTLTEEEIGLCREHKELDTQIKELETQKKAVDIDFKAKLVARAKPNKAEKKLSASGGGFSVSWSFCQRRSVDSDALKKAGIFEQYCKTSEYDRMTITAAKKKGA